MPDFVAGEIVTANKMNQIPKGVLGYAQVTSGQSGITSMTDLTGLSVTVNISAGRIIRITGHGLLSVSNFRSVAAGWIREGSSTLGRFGSVDNQALTANAFALGHGAVILSSPSPGQHTYKLSLEVTSGSGTASLQAFTTSPAYILVEDLGADPNA